jgi:hypothetical protein
MRFVTILMFFLMISILSCKDKTSMSNSQDATSTDMTTYPLLNQDNLPAVEIKSMRTEATAVLAHRLKENGSKVPTSIEKDIWAIDAVVFGSKMLAGDSIYGNWIDFKDDFSYNYGLYGVQNGAGKYHYDLDAAKLLLLDNNEGIKPQQLEVKMANDMLVLVGEALYKDNNIQTKLTRIATAPIKK